MRARLRILHFNDLHGRLADLDGPESRPVFSRIAGAIARARAEAEGDPATGVLVLSGGDDLIGSPFAELQGSRPAQFRSHPAYRAYTAAGVDACGIGNHDLDWGLEMLVLAAGRDAAFPLLSANLIPSGPPPPALRPYTVFERAGIRVGVIGLTTPGEINQLKPGEFKMAHPVETVLTLLPEVRAQSDLVIVLSHLGHSLDNPYALGAIAGDVELAAALPPGAVDAIIGAHTHTVLNRDGLSQENIVNGSVLAQAGSRGEYLGEVVIEVEQDDHGRRRARVVEVRLHPVDLLPAGEDFDATHVTPLVSEIRPILVEPLGIVEPHPDLADERIRSAWGAGESALGNFLADAIATRCRAAGVPVDFAMVDSSSVAAGLQPGPLTYEDVRRVVPFADTLVLYELMPSQAEELIRDNLRRLNPDGEPPLERGFLQFSREVRYGYAPAGLHLPDFAARRTLRVAASSFVRLFATHWERTSGLPNLFELRALPAVQTGLVLREELVPYIRAAGGITAASGLVRDGRLTLDPGPAVINE